MPTTSLQKSSERTVRRRKTRKAKAQAKWTVLCYIAGDLNSSLAEKIREDLAETLAVRSTAEVSIAVQFDGKDGAFRYVLPEKQEVETLGRVNSGSASVLADFLRWGFSMCPADRIGLVISGQNALDPSSEEDEEGKCGQRVFTICRDDSSGGHMDVVDFGRAIREVLDECQREQIELLAVDSCYTQFLELAYELEGRVQTLLASQTEVPPAGWNYTKVLKKWVGTVRRSRDGVDSRAMAKALLPSIKASYASQPESQTQEPAVSALDLRVLNDVARVFDTLCIGVLQVLGEGLIWNTREILLELFHKGESRSKANAYDCGSFFALTEAALVAMADEGCQRWLAKTLERSGKCDLKRFRDAVARQLEQTIPNDPRLRRLVKALRLKDPAPRGEALLNEMTEGVRRRIQLAAAVKSARRKRAAIKTMTDNRRESAEEARERDRLVEEAILAQMPLLPQERRFDFQRLKDSITAARRLAEQAREAALTLLGSNVEQELEPPVNEKPAKEPSPRESYDGIVVDFKSTSSSLVGWPRWSGVSLYRPDKLDDLMNATYQRFAFHQRVHWAAMLGAANLIKEHPRALWRLVSSLLATGSAGTRRDVLRRLTGQDSVIWGLRDQFQVMAPAPTLTLSLEKRNRNEKSDNGQSRSWQEYVLRLESVVRGATVTEQISRVQPAMLDRALRELGDLLQADVATRDLLRRLRSIGSLLGEDIFQSLGRTLEDERLAALEDMTNSNAHLQLQIPNDFMQYPWELLHHRGEWLSERFAIGRQVFMQTGMARPVTRRKQCRLRCLIIGDPVFDPNPDPKLRWRQLPGARDEALQVAGLFEQLHNELGEVIDFDRKRDTRINTRLTTGDFRELLRSGGYDIIHFAGHGIFRGEDPETSSWLLSDGELWASEIRNTLINERATPPWLVYANACEAAMESGQRPVTYQGNVFGLATAFINQGVAAYIAPLWPIDDLLAQQIAIDFYRQLLCQRATLGEALRRAKATARQLTYPDLVEEARVRAADSEADTRPPRTKGKSGTKTAGTAPENNGASSPEEEEVAWTGLGWASLVLYGDPTEELFQALAGGGRSETPATKAASEPPRPSEPLKPTKKWPIPRAATGFLHAPDHVLINWVSGPALKPLEASKRGVEVPEGEGTLELVEDGGLRRWRFAGNGSGTKRGPQAVDDGLPNSNFAKLLDDDRIRGELRGNRGIIRVIGRWVIKGGNKGLRGLAEEYDREQVANEGLLLIPGGDAKSMVPLTVEGLGAKPTNSKADQVLLLIHGTFSKTASPVEGFGPEFLAWARQRYRAVIGFDHWTLSKSPKENAETLLDQLRVIDANLLEGRRLDIISHSRGGLVGRAFCEILKKASAVRNLIFLGTPNCGTDLANPRNWGILADTLVNLSGLDHAELFGRLAGLLARFAVAKGEGSIPGLMAQNPETAGSKNSFLWLLQKSDEERNGVRYAVVTAEFEPPPLVPNLKGLLKAARDAGINSAVDEFFQDANDLVVNTSHTWCIDQNRNKGRKLPKLLSADRVLAFVPPKPTVEMPSDIKPVTALGIHHCNLFSQKRAQQRIKEWLSEV